MDLRQMEYFVTLADEQQFTRAAAITNVSQSGLSAAIRALEEELGTPLFRRTTRRVEPTEAGLALLPHARAMLNQALDGRDAVVRATQKLSGTLRVGSEQCLGVIDVTALVERFHRRHPQVSVEFTQAGSQQLLAQVRADEIDVAFVATSEHLATLPRLAIGRESIVLLCPPGHPLATRARVGWEDLDGERFIDFDESWGVRGINDAACAANGVRRQVRCTVNDIHTMLDLLHRGMGIAMVPAPVARKPQAEGLVVVQLPRNGARSWDVSAVSGTSRQASSIAPQLLELLDPPRTDAA
jgi:DNA-binding transcriptional LysR family regulator